MKKIILAVAVAALAIMAVASSASADVVRCTAPLAAATEVTFTVTEPAGAEHQFNNVWIHTYTVTVQPDGSFVGTGSIVYSGAPGVTGSDHTYSVDIVGTFEGATVSYVATRTDGLAYIVKNAPTDGSLNLNATTTFTLNGAPYTSPWSYETKTTAPLFTAPTTTDMNHGQYVKAQGGGKVAAQACAGMPVNSTQGK